MATQTKTSPGTEKHFDEAAERIREVNERIIASARKAGNATLDTYERALHSMADLSEKAGSASQLDWVAAIAQAQAEYTRDLATAYTSAARTLLK